MSEVFDNRLRLLMGEGLYAGNIFIKPKTLREIVKTGYTHHMTLLNVISLTHEDILNEELGDEMLEQMRNFTVCEILFIFGETDLRESYKEALEYFLDAKFEGIDANTHTIRMSGDLEIDSSTLEKILSVLRKQNGQDGSVEEKVKESNAKSEKAKKILEKLQKGKKKVEEIKRKENSGEDTMDFYSIVSAVSTKSNSINKLNVWDLTLHQLYDEFDRLQIIDGYNTSLAAMMQGAEIKDLKHWASKVED